MANYRYVGIGRETGDYGTSVAAVRYAECPASIKPDLGWIKRKPIAMRSLQTSWLGKYRARGKIGELSAEPENILPDLIYGALGSIYAVTSKGNGCYQHSIIPGDTLPSFTVRLGVEKTERVLPGCLVDNLRIHYPAEEEAKLSADIVSGFAETKATLGTPTFPTVQPFSFQYYPGPTSGTRVDVDGRSMGGLGLVYDAEVLIANKIPFQRGCLDYKTFPTIRAGSREVTGKISMYFDDTTEYDRFIAGTPFSLAFYLDGPIAGGTNKYWFGVTLPKCKYEGGAPDVTPQDEPLVIDAPFTAYYNAGPPAGEILIALINKITAL
jgi:hypothetical protein